MRQEQRTKNTYYNVYVANDGTEFNDKDECLKYEQSAYAVVNTHYQQLVVATGEEDMFFGFGCCDNRLEFVKVKSNEDADLVMQMDFVVNTHHAKDTENYKTTLDHMRGLLKRAIEEDDILLVDRGYDDESFWFVGTRNSMKEKIDEIVKKNTEDK